MSTVQSVLLVLTAQTLLWFAHGNVDLSTVEVASRFHNNIIRLSCDGGAAEGAVSFHRTAGQTTSIVVSLDDGDPVTSRELTFQITPATEGEYHCEVAGERSNSVTFVAYPHSDPTIKRVYTARLGETIEMQCTIPIGVLRNRYSVQWYKGINTEITNSTSDEFGHIGVNENSGALVFSGVKAYDASKGYFCAVTVEMVRGDVRRQGSTIALHVSVSLHMTRPLNIHSMAAAVGAEVSFTCQASGVPAAEFRWSLNGSQYRNGITTTNDFRTSTVVVTSTLVLPSVVVEDTGTVMCVAFHENSSSSTVIATSSANLIVLTNNFEVDLAFQDGQVVVSGTLPVFIVGFFSLQVHFYSTERVPQKEERVIPLADTNNFDIVIPRERLPCFRSFSVAVAIGSNSRYGELTEKTDPIDLRETSLGPRDCLSTSASISGGGDSVVVVISVLVVLVVVGIIVLLAVGGLIYYRKSVPGKATSEFSVSHGSLRRSASRCSYASERSGRSSRSSRSSRSKTYGSESGASDSSANVVMKVTTKDQLRDVRDYETIDHKMLKQWEETKAHFGKNQFDGHGSCENVGRVDAGHGPVFPHTHLGIPNPHLVVQQQAFRDSQSSFEDLEHECLEFSTEVPKSC